MKKQKNLFFSRETLKDLKLDEKQMTKVFGGEDPILEITDGSHTKTIKYDRFTTYTESTYVRSR